MVKALILDLDGTLVDSHKAHIKSYKEVFNKKALNEFDVKKLKSLFGKVAEDIISELFPSLSEKEVDELVLGKREAFLKAIDKVVKVPCVDKFLRRAFNDYSLAVATSSSNLEMNALVDRFGWSDYFKVLMSGYDVSRPKPAPDLLLMVIKELGLKKDDCVFIGDSIYDALSARSAGVSFIGVRTGSYSKKDFDEQGFKSFKDLCELLSFKVLF
ncbi:HAD-IA family hydrolase|nr:HAD-IA family hydrolase [archaeon]